MSKNKEKDFIDEEQFLSSVSRNKVGGCVRVGKPPADVEPAVSQEAHDETPKDNQPPSSQSPVTPRQGTGRRSARQTTSDSVLDRLKASRENLQRKAVYVRLDHHVRYSMIADLLKVPVAQLMDSILDEWWEANRDEMQSLYDKGRCVFDNM